MSQSSVSISTDSSPRQNQAGVFFLINLAALIGAFLVSAQIRTRLPWGNALGAEYDPVPLLFYPVLLIALLAAYGIARLSGMTPLGRTLNDRRHYRVLLLAIMIAALGALIVVPDLSQLQLIYFVVLSVITGFCVIFYPGKISVSEDRLLIGDYLRRLWDSRYLLRLWLGYNVQARYTQTILGILWIILLPLATSAVLALAFSEFLRVQIDVPYISFFLSGLVTWSLFSQGVLTGMRSILAATGLINQINFPREVLVLLALGEVLVDFLFTFAAMILINALNGIFPNIYWIYLPFLIFVLVTFTLGLMLILSCLSMLVRDIPQLVGVVLQLMFYLTPLIYPIDRIPDQFRILLLLNPLAGVIQGFRDVIVYARPPDLLTLYYPFVAGLVLLYAGYSYFKAHEEMLADVI
ncbi:MAG: ABC transporter permease [Anaerolineae bacterium]|nr:ABC transporter permease [Anaerolineae bacterium]